MANETVAVPKELFDLLEQSKLGALDPDARVRVALAIHLFQTQEVSIGRAAELAEFSLGAFYDLLVALGLPTVTYGSEEWAQDMETLERMERERAGRDR